MCPKVRLEDFIYVTNKQELYKYRGYIKSRHIDFLICDNDLHIKFAIELDDKTHNTEKAKSTDEFKKGSMLPKIEACIDFVENNPRGKSIITSLGKVKEALEGKIGTKIIKE